MHGAGSNHPLDVFPEPNPPFPAPPRPRRWRSYLVVLGLVCLGVVIFAAIPYLPFEKFGPILLWFLGGCVCFVVALLILNDLGRAVVWRKGRILPARVLAAPTGPPTSLVWQLIGFIPFLGFLISMIASFVTGPRNSVLLAYKVGPQTVVKPMATNRHWKYYRDQLDVWVLMNRKNEPVPIELVAPADYHFTEVPINVSQWLDDSIAPEFRLQAEQHKQSVLDRDMIEAAKANKRAHKKAGMYEKRPD